MRIGFAKPLELSVKYSCLSEQVNSLKHVMIIANIVIHDQHVFSTFFELYKLEMSEFGETGHFYEYDSIDMYFSCKHSNTFFLLET